MVATAVVAGKQNLLRHYDDGLGWGNYSTAKEQAFRKGFLEEARRITDEWVDPDDDDFDPRGEEEAAHRLRLRIRERYAVYGRGDAGRKTYHLGWRSGHAVAAARARGRHHALAYVTQAWEDVSDFDTFDYLVIPAWLRAVEEWASKPIRPKAMSPPPRPLWIKGASLVRRPSRNAQKTPSAKASSGNLVSVLNSQDTPTTSPAPATERVASVRMADVTPEPVRWLWPGRFALGKLSLIAGEPGLGKSFVTLDMAARVTRGAGWPCGGPAPSQPGGVVLLSAEDDLKDTIRPRLDAAGADCSRIEAMQAIYRPDYRRGTEVAVPFNLVEHIHHMETLIRKVGACKLVVVDPVSAFLGATDSHNNSEVRAVLAPLAEMAARHRVAVVAVTHLNKGQGSALNRVVGSIAFTAAARAAYVVTRDADDGTRRLMAAAKNNLGCDDTGFAYRLEGDPTPHVEWEPAPVTISADEALGGGRRTRGPMPDARRDAEAWLTDFLAAGPQPAKEVYAKAGEDGHTKDTIRRAKAALGVEATKAGFQGAWVWVLPGSGPVMTGGDGGDSKGTAKGTEGGLP